MAYDLQHNGESYFNDATIKTLRGASLCITNAMVNASAAIASSKLVNRICPVYKTVDGVNVAATTGDGIPIYVCTKAGGATLIGVHVVCPDAPSGGDLAFTVDIKKADDDPTAATTMLTTPITVNSTVADYEPVSDTSPNVTAIDNGDVILVVVAVSGSTGTQGQGLLVQLDIDEAGS